MNVSPPTVDVEKIECSPLVGACSFHRCKPRSPCYPYLIFFVIPPIPAVSKITKDSSLKTTSSFVSYELLRVIMKICPHSWRIWKCEKIVSYFFLLNFLFRRWKMCSNKIERWTRGRLSSSIALKRSIKSPCLTKVFKSWNVIMCSR